MNAKEELQGELEGASIVAAKIELYGDSFTLKAGHSKEELQKFWEWMDQSYDNGWGYQNLSGTVWLSEGRLAGTGEYDGSRWWETKKRPELPSP